MRSPVRLPVAVLAAVVTTAVWPGGATGEPTASQKLFTQHLLDDPKTSAGVKRLLRTRAGIVSPRSGFLDVTGDERPDALVLVTTTGAAGNVALYVFSTHGQDAGDATELRVLFRLQSLYRAALRVDGTSLSVLEPRFEAGDDLCCPARLRDRVYRFTARDPAFVRSADITVDAGTPADG